MISWKRVRCHGRAIGTTIFTYPCIPAARVYLIYLRLQRCVPVGHEKEIFNLSRGRAARNIQLSTTNDPNVCLTLYLDACARPRKYACRHFNIVPIRDRKSSLSYEINARHAHLIQTGDKGGFRRKKTEKEKLKKLKSSTVSRYCRKFLENVRQIPYLQYVCSLLALAVYVYIYIFKTKNFLAFNSCQLQSHPRRLISVVFIHLAVPCISSFYRKKVNLTSPFLSRFPLYRLNPLTSWLILSASMLQFCFSFVSSLVRSGIFLSCENIFWEIPADNYPSFKADERKYSTSVSSP